MFNNVFSENRVVYDIMWKNMVRTRQATGGNAIRRMRFARWITKATNTHAEYVNTYAFSRQSWLYDGALLLRYAYRTCFVS